MAKLSVLSGKNVCAILSKQGFVEVRRRGSHVMMQKKLSKSTITVPVPDHKELRIGTLQSLSKTIPKTVDISSIFYENG